MILTLYFILFYFRTTKSGNLPNLSYVQRKPEPLGTEFKNLVDGMVGDLCWLEVQEGKERMSKKQYHMSLGACSATVMRGVVDSSSSVPIPLGVERPMVDNDGSEGTNYKKLFLGDSWFGSVRSCLEVAKAGHHSCFIIKQGNARSPKKFLEETMKDFPGGIWIVLEAEDGATGIDLVCIGYKYNKKKVLTFILSKGAGSTLEGEPYEARFPDRFGNVCIRHVARPQVVSNYFKYCNVVDLHNQARQFDLALENSG